VSFCAICRQETPAHEPDCPVATGEWQRANQARRQEEERALMHPEAFERQITAIRVAFAGLWIGLWVGALALSAWGIVFVNTHPLSDYRSCFWFWVSFGPLALLAFRLWKWILTICLLAFCGHEIHKLNKWAELLVGAWIGHKLSQPHNQRRARNYWAWLTRKPQGPGELSNRDRLELRLAVLFGAAIYTLSVLSAYPARRGLTNDTPIPEPTPPPGQTYSQNTLVIHSDGVASTQSRTQSNADLAQDPGSAPSYSQNTPVVHSDGAVSTQRRTQRNADLKHGFAQNRVQRHSVLTPTGYYTIPGMVHYPADPDKVRIPKGLDPGEMKDGGSYLTLNDINHLRDGEVPRGFTLKQWKALIASWTKGRK
jgi:hypothetical protein